MDRLPALLDAEDALDVLRSTPKPSQALLALIIAELSKTHVNRKIRALTGIRKDYQVSHLKRAGKVLSVEQLNLWHNNPKMISLGHVRALCSMSSSQREYYLRKLLTTKITVGELEAIAAKRSLTTGHASDLERYARKMGEATGRIVTLSYRPALSMGKITLSWHGYDDLDAIAQKLGFNPQEYL